MSDSDETPEHFSNIQSCCFAFSKCSILTAILPMNGIMVLLAQGIIFITNKDIKNTQALSIVCIIYATISIFCHCCGMSCIFGLFFEDVRQYCLFVEKQSNSVQPIHDEDKVPDIKMKNQLILDVIDRIFRIIYFSSVFLPPIVQIILGIILVFNRSLVLQIEIAIISIALSISLFVFIIIIWVVVGLLLIFFVVFLKNPEELDPENKPENLRDSID